jgi:hypothetical protein
MEGRMKSKEEVGIPFQVQNLIDSLNDKNETTHIRQNYYARLDSIKTAIDRALKSYDREMGESIMLATRKKNPR